MKTFTDMLTKEACGIWEYFTKKPELVAYATKGFPVALAAYLQQELADSEDGSGELIIKFSGYGDICSFQLKAVKKGDSVAFIPEFELLEGGKSLMNADTMPINLSESKVVDRLIIDLSKNERLIECMKHGFGDWVYVDSKWEKDTSGDAAHGLLFASDPDVIAMVVCYVVTFLSVLCDNKDSTNIVEYPVDGFATFKIACAKNGYDVTATFEKEFKGNCKSDELAEKISNKIAQ